MVGVVGPGAAVDPSRLALGRAIDGKRIGVDARVAQRDHRLGEPRRDLAHLLHRALRREEQHGWRRTRRLGGAGSKRQHNRQPKCDQNAYRRTAAA